MSDYVPVSYYRRVVGVDPGYVNMGVCEIEFCGLRYNEDYTEEIPVFRILHWQLWDLRAGMSMCNSQPNGGRFVRCSTRARPLPSDTLETNIKASTLDDWLAQMNYFINRSAWLFERSGDEKALPDITVENQFDQIKSRGNKHDMLLISRVFSNSIDALDKRNAEPVAIGQLRPLYERKFAKSTLKHGIKNDGVLTYGGRKGTSVEIAYVLLKQLGFKEWIVFLESVAASGQKIDDLCDAFMLALAYATREYEAHLKQLRKKPASSNNSNKSKDVKMTHEEAVRQFALRNTPCGDMDRDIMCSTNNNSSNNSGGGVRLLSERRLNNTTDDDIITEETFFPENCGADDTEEEVMEDDYELDSDEEDRVQAAKEKERRQRAEKQKQKRKERAERKKAASSGTRQVVIKRSNPKKKTTSPVANSAPTTATQPNKKTKRATVDREANDDDERADRRPAKKTRLNVPVTIQIDDTIVSSSSEDDVT